MIELKNIMLFATAFAPSLTGAKELPNIIYIVTDQQTASAMSCMGNADLHTPNMDQGVHVYGIYLPRGWPCTQ